MKLFVVFGFLCLGAVLAVPTGETAVEKVETEELADTKATLFLTEETDGLTNERQERSYGYKPEHKGHSGHGGHGYGHEHKGHGYGHESHHGGHGYGHEHKGHGYGHESHHGGHGYGHEHKGHGYGHDHKGHGGHGYGHEHKGHGGHGYGHEQKGHGGHGYGHEQKGHGYGHGHGHGYKSNFDAAEQFDSQADFVASPQYGHAAPAYGHHHGGHAGHYVQPVHHQTHSYGAHAPKVECGSNLLVGCNVHTAKVPCVPHHGHGYGHAAPAYHAPAHYGAPTKYEHKPAAHHGYKFGADEEPKEQPKEDKQ